MYANLCIKWKYIMFWVIFKPWLVSLETNLQMGKLLEGLKILCSDFDHVLEKRGDIIHGRIRYLSLFGKCERLLLKINPPTTTNRPYFQFQGDRIGCPYICRWKKKSHLIKNIAHRKRCNRIALLRKHEGTCFSSLENIGWR